MSTINFCIYKKAANGSPPRPNALNKIPDRNPPLQPGLEFEHLIFTKYGNSMQTVEDFSLRLTESAMPPPYVRTQSASSA